MGVLNRDDRDATDPRDRKLRRGVVWVERAYDDRWPCRGQANIAAREYRPLEDVSREGRRVPYRKYPAER